MPRAHRHRIPGQVWHITGRCHRRQFLLKFARDRRRWVSWLYEARKRYGLCVLNYQVTSNHVHLVARDRGEGEIERAMQLIEGQTGQGYNRRKNRRGAFWEDRYHSTAVDTDEHLMRCLVYVDLNMVRAGVVTHPEQWGEAGYHEIQRAKGRRRIIDRSSLGELLGVEENRLAKVYREWVESRLAVGELRRERQWSEAIAVGRRSFVERVQEQLGKSGRYRKIEAIDGDWVLREVPAPYGCDSDAKMGAASAKSASDSG